MHKRIVGITNQSTNWSRPFAEVAHVHGRSKELQLKFADAKQTTFYSREARSDPSKHQTSKSALLLRDYYVCKDKLQR